MVTRTRRPPGGGRDLLDVDGAAIRQLRNLVGLGREALAEQAGIASRTLSRLELGETKKATPAVAQALADALGRQPVLVAVVQPAPPDQELVGRLRDMGAEGAGPITAAWRLIVRDAA